MGWIVLAHRKVVLYGMVKRIWDGAASVILDLDRFSDFDIATLQTSEVLLDVFGGNRTIKELLRFVPILSSADIKNAANTAGQASSGTRRLLREYFTARGH